MARATLTISSKNYSSWSLRGWLLCRLAELPFDEAIMPTDDPSARAELLLLSPSFKVPCLTHGEVVVWDTLAIAEYLNEIRPEACLLPKDIKARAHARAIAGEMHSGFANLRAALPQNIKGRHPNFKIWAGAQADINHVLEIWTHCFQTYGAPFLFSDRPNLADVMYAPICGRFLAYDVKLDKACLAYRDRILALPEMSEWITGAMIEPEDLEELDVEF